jgi:hypothetical protein
MASNLIKAIGMSMTSGQSIFGFIGRVVGTAFAMVFSIVIWYIVDQKTPGIIVMLWLFVFLEMYFFIKFQRLIGIFLVAIITQILIIGYELQVRKIGIAAGGYPSVFFHLRKHANSTKRAHQVSLTIQFTNLHPIDLPVLLVVPSWHLSGPSSPIPSPTAAGSAKTSAQRSIFLPITIALYTQQLAPECTTQKVIPV